MQLGSVNRVDHILMSTISIALGEPLVVAHEEPAPIGNIPPAEAKARYYAQVENAPWRRN